MKRAGNLWQGGWVEADNIYLLVGPSDEKFTMGNHPSTIALK